MGISKFFGKPTVKGKVFITFSRAGALGAFAFSPYMPPDSQKHIAELTGKVPPAHRASSKDDADTILNFIWSTELIGGYGGIPAKRVHCSVMLNDTKSEKDKKIKSFFFDPPSRITAAGQEPFSVEAWIDFAPLANFVESLNYQELTAEQASSSRNIGSKRIAPEFKYVEDLVEHLRDSQTDRIACIALYAGSVPITFTAGDLDECLPIFSSKRSADVFMDSYNKAHPDKTFCRPFKIANECDVWTLLTTKSRDNTYAPPYGLVFNPNNKGQPFTHFPKARIIELGKEGLLREITQAGLWFK